MVCINKSLKCRKIADEKNLRTKWKLLMAVLLVGNDGGGIKYWWCGATPCGGSDKLEWENYCVCLWVNVFCWANCNLSFLREINDVFKNQNENWYFRIYSPSFVFLLVAFFFLVCVFSSSIFQSFFHQLSVPGSFRNRKFSMCIRVCERVCVCVCVCPCVNPTHTHNLHVSSTSCVPNFSPAFFGSLFSLSFCSIQFRSVLNFTVVLLPLACCFRINDLKWCDGAISLACMFQNHFSIYKMFILSINTFIWRHCAVCIRCIHNNRSIYTPKEIDRWIDRERSEWARKRERILLSLAIWSLKGSYFYFYIYFVYVYRYLVLLSFSVVLFHSLHFFFIVIIINVIIFV